MFDEILRRYGDFHDALVTEVRYMRSINETKAEIQVRCINCLDNGNKWELVLFTFDDVKFFRLVEGLRINSTVILNAVFTTDGEFIVADFQASNVGPDSLEIDDNSTFIIKSRAVGFRIIEILEDYQS